MSVRLRGFCVRRGVVALTLTAAIAWGQEKAGAAHSDQPPSLVVVFVDDLGFGDLPCFADTPARTPNIDRLAREGLRFRQFYVNSPICSPSRVALTTGQYPQRHRITSFLNHRAANERRGMVSWLDPQAVTLPGLLARRGYRVGHFGKWHMGGQRDVGDAPPISAYGFDASLTNFEGLGPRVLPLCHTPGKERPRRHGLGSGKLGRGPIEWLDRSRVTEEYVRAARRFIGAARERGEPFYVNVWPDDVHTPLHPPRGSWPTKTVGGQRVPSMDRRQRLVAVVEALDRQLEPLFEDLRQHAARGERTLLLLCSDNGPELPCGSAGPLRNGKATLFEGGIRSPLIVWGPGLLAPGAGGSIEGQAVMSAIDLVPSLLRLTRTPIPQDTSFDGEELAQTLLGFEHGGRQQPLFFRRPPDRDRMGRSNEDLPDLAVRAGRWKLVCEYDGSDARLYDLVEDFGETQDVSSTHPDRTRQLIDSVLAWHRAMPADRGPELAK